VERSDPVTNARRLISSGMDFPFFDLESDASRRP
jgi:hypothetical protein